MRDSNPIQFSRNRENRRWFAGPSHRGSHSPTRGHGRRASRRPLSTRSRRRLADAPAFMPTFVQDDGRFRFSAELFIVARSAPRADRHSQGGGLQRRETCGQEMSSTRALRHSWAVALVILFVSGGPARAQTKPSVATAAEELNRSTEALARALLQRSSRFSRRLMCRLEGVVARASDLVTTQRASGSGVIVHPDGYIVTDPLRKRCAAAARRYPAAGHRRLDSRGAKPHRRRGDCRHRSRNGPRGNQVDGRSLATLPFGNADDLRTGQLVLSIGLLDSITRCRSVS